MDREHRPPNQGQKKPSSEYARWRQEYESHQRWARDFYKALQQGDLDTLRRLKPQEFPQAFWGTTPLHVAVQSDNVATISLLLDWYGDINRGDDFGDTP